MIKFFIKKKEKIKDKVVIGILIENIFLQFYTSTNNFTFFRAEDVLHKFQVISLFELTSQYPDLLKNILEKIEIAIANEELNSHIDFMLSYYILKVVYAKEIFSEKLFMYKITKYLIVKLNYIIEELEKIN